MLRSIIALRISIPPLVPVRTSHVRLKGKSVKRRQLTPHVLIDLEEDPYPYLRSIMDPKRQQSRNAQKKGAPRSTPETRTSKSMAWLLRHGAQKEGIEIRPDGFVKMTDLLVNQRMRNQTFLDVEEVVKNDPKGRYSLIQEAGIWLIRANQGHSIRTVKMELEPITHPRQIPMAVHGTSTKAWESISQQGLSKMNRNHIHLAQGLAGHNVISGMRQSCQIMIYIDLQKALEAGFEFFLSENGVVLSEGDGRGFIPPQFFKRVENANRVALPGWEGDGPVADAQKVLTEHLPAAVEDVAKRTGDDGPAEGLEVEALVERSPVSTKTAAAGDSRLADGNAQELAGETTRH